MRSLSPVLVATTAGLSAGTECGGRPCLVRSCLPDCQCCFHRRRLHASRYHRGRQGQDVYPWSLASRCCGFEGARSVRAKAVWRRCFSAWTIEPDPWPSAGQVSGPIPSAGAWACRGCWVLAATLPLAGLDHCAHAAVVPPSGPCRSCAVNDGTEMMPGCGNLPPKFPDGRLYV